MFLEFRCVEIATLAFKVSMVEFTEADKVLSAEQVRIGWARHCAIVGQVDKCCHCPSLRFSLNSRQTKSYLQSSINEAQTLKPICSIQLV